MSLIECAQQGAAALDEVAPGWTEKIDLDALRMESCRNCVLGQVFGDFWNAYTTGGVFGSEDACTHSFEYGFDDENAEYDELGEAWRAVLASR